MELLQWIRSWVRSVPRSSSCKWFLWKKVNSSSFAPIYCHRPLRCNGDEGNERPRKTKRQRTSSQTWNKNGERMSPASMYSISDATGAACQPQGLRNFTIHLSVISIRLSWLAKFAQCSPFSVLFQYRNLGRSTGSWFRWLLWHNYNARGSYDRFFLRCVLYTCTPWCCSPQSCSP